MYGRIYTHSILGECVKIGILGLKGNFNKNIGQGVQTYTYRLTEHLKKILSDRDLLDKIELGFGNGNTARRLSFSLCELLFDGDKYDIIHMPNPVLFNPRGHTKKITTVHDLYILPESNPKLYDLYRGSPTVHLSFWQITHSDFIITDTEQTQKEVLTLGYPREKTKVVNLGVDARYTSTPVPKKNHKTFVVGYLGGIGAKRNLTFAINAFENMEGRNTRFDLWGKFDAKKDFDKYSTSAAPNIRFMGFAPESKKVGIYDSFDAYVFPSLYEGFGLTIIEAQSRGLPVIIYKKALISKEVKKYCIEAEDEAHMSSILSDLKENGYNEKLKRKATAYARRFIWEKTAKETLDIYKKVAD